MAGFNYTGFSINDDVFNATIGADGTIYQVSMANGNKPVGLDNEGVQLLQNTIKDMQETLDSWRPKMIEHRIYSTR